MRLTLRTLLAYLDEMLEPADAEALREKIGQNEQAAAIVQRVQDVVRRLRIGAPKLNDKGLAADANAVAEYLDNTMSPAKVADFERACLESDVHLAEVAACHQILTLVLREQAEVDASARQRMYELVERVTSPTPPAQESPLDGPPVSKPPVSAPPVSAAAELVSAYAVVEESAEPQAVANRHERRRPEVPDYLRDERRSQWWPMAAATLLLAALVGALYVAVVGPPEWLGGGRPVAEGDGAEPSPPPVHVTPTPHPGLATVPAVPNGAPSPEPAIEELEAEEEPHISPEIADDMPQAPVDPGPDLRPAAPEEPPAVPPVPTEPAPTTETPAAPTTEPPAVPAGEPPAAPAGEPTVVVARVTKEDALVLRFDRAGPTWQRLVAGEVINGDEPLLVLPVFRPALVLETGPAVEPLGPTDFSFLGPDASGVEGVTLKYGQMRIFANGNAGSKLRVAFGERESLLTFVDPEAVVAIDLGFWRNPGDDPSTIRPAEVFGAYAIAGRVEWSEAEGLDQPRPVAGPAMIVTPMLPSGPAATDLPPWLSPDITPLIDRKAAATIAQETFERGVVLTLKEQAERPQVEVRSLAARCLCQIGEFDAALQMLDDKDLRQYWDDLTLALVSAVNRGPGDAQRVREAFNLQFGGQGAAAYRMLWGYSNEQLAAGSDRELVDALENDRLGVRRLAIWNLSNITGASMLYTPEQTAKSRQTPMQKWRARLKRGEIRYGGPPAPAEPGPPVEAPAIEAPAPAEPAPGAPAPGVPAEGVGPGDL